MKAADIAAVGGGIKNLAIGAAVILAIGAAVYVVRGAARILPAAASAAVDAINPTNSGNIFNTAANAAAGFDNESGSIGTWLYDLFHPGE